MIYLKHNVKGNFMNAAGFRDEHMQEDIILSEIAKLIVVKPELIVDYLNKSGMKIKGTPSKRRLTKLVSEGLNKSKGFATLIAKEIIGMGSTFNGNGENAENWASMGESTASIVASLASLFGGNKKNTKPPVHVQQNLNSHVNAINTIANDGLSTGTKVLIGFAIGVPLLIGGIFAIRALR